MRKFFIIVDKYTDGKKAVNIWNKLQNYLDDQKVNYEVSSTQPDLATNIAEKFVRTHSSQDLDSFVILAVGGHNLMLDTIKGVRNAGKREVPVAFITTKKKDPFLQKIGISPNPISALKQILNAVQPTYFNLGQVDETTHDSRRLFTDKLDIGFTAYVSNSMMNSHIHQIFSKFHLSYLLRIWHSLTSYINQETFDVTMRVDKKYNFYKHTFNVTIKNNPVISKQGTYHLKNLEINANNLNIELVNNINFLFYLVFLIARKFNFHHKLPFVHRFESDQIHLVIKSLEFGQIDGHQMNNKFYDVFFKSFSYPFWYDIDSIPLSDLPKKDNNKIPSQN
ncbi:diacylglycerol kinase family protein [Liquorilactobacillus uvarum]|uniref:diacylglycerol kinase family protein n=1 Tax=Liquorilactobacillus uvarum TaxID=303240 RepID=UPI00288903E0|nr:diacylglycerol kinase family protein [Liquorilactobacillus uvarum]